MATQNVTIPNPLNTGDTLNVTVASSSGPVTTPLTLGITVDDETPEAANHVVTLTGTTIKIANKP